MLDPAPEQLPSTRGSADPSERDVLRRNPREERGAVADRQHAAVGGAPQDQAFPVDFLRNPGEFRVYGSCEDGTSGLGELQLVGKAVETEVNLAFGAPRFRRSSLEKGTLAGRQTASVTICVPEGRAGRGEGWTGECVCRSVEAAEQSMAFLFYR